MKKLLAAFFAFAIIAGVQVYSASAGEMAHGQRTIAVNGQTLAQFPYEMNGCTLVPARAVSDALGFKIEWNNDDQSATIVGDAMQMNVKVGVDSYMATSTIAIGATAPAHFGSAPLLVNDTLYVPAQIFRIIQGNDPATVSESDSQVVISKAK